MSRWLYLFTTRPMRLNAPQYKQQSRSDGYLSRRFDDEDYDVRYRWYYMAGEIYIKFLFSCWRIFHTLVYSKLLKREILCLQANINTIEIPMKPFHFCCKMHNLLCNLSNGDLFTWEDIMFSHEISPGISSVFV